MRRRDMLSLLSLVAVSCGYNASLQNNRDTLFSPRRLGLLAVSGGGSQPAAMPQPGQKKAEEGRMELGALVRAVESLVRSN